MSYTRNCLNMRKCEHFLDFIFSSGLLQGVAYGVHKIKFDSGNKGSFLKAILTTRYSHAIGRDVPMKAFFWNYCVNPVKSCQIC